MNEVRIDGTIFRDVEIKQGSDYIMSKFTLLNRNMRNNESNFFEVKTWDDLANATQNLNKGDFISVEGSLKLESWEDKKDGSKKSKVNIVAKKIFLNGNELTEPTGTVKRKNITAPTGEIDFADKLPF